jgi:hypothetical protein
MTDAVDIAFYALVAVSVITIVAAAWVLLRRP